MSDEKDGSMKKQRLYYLDWLRILAIFMVFVYHFIRIFSGRNEIINDPEYMMGAYLTEWIIIPFGMPLFFIISGMSVFYGIQYMKKKGLPKTTFIKERTIRLLIPYLIAILTYLSVIFALYNAIKGTYTLKYASIYDPRNFIDFYFTAYFTGDNATLIVVGMHLWFLLLLFIMNLIFYKPFTSKVFKNNINIEIKENKEIKKPKSLFLLIIPLYLIEIINPFGLLDLPRWGGWDNLNYFVFFYLGFKFVSEGNLQEKLKKSIKTALIIGITTLILRIVEFFLHTNNIIEYELYNWVFFLYWALYVINGWSLMIVILYFFGKYLNKDHKLRKKLNEIVMPFYILHYIVLNIVAVYAIDFFASNPVISIGRFLIIGGLSFIIILGLSLLIAKIRILRPIFGMRIK